MHVLVSIRAPIRAHHFTDEVGFYRPTRSERCPQKRDAVALELHGESRSAQAEGPGHGRVPTRAGVRRPLPTLQEAERPLSLPLGPWTPPHLWGVRVTAGHANEQRAQCQKAWMGAQCRYALATPVQSVQVQVQGRKGGMLKLSAGHLT